MLSEVVLGYMARLPGYLSALRTLPQLARNIGGYESDRRTGSKKSPDLALADSSAADDENPETIEVSREYLSIWSGRPQLIHHRI